MNYRVLGKPIDCGCSSYRGLYRDEPEYISEDASPEINDYWNWYATEAGDAGFVHDSSKAVQLISAYKCIAKEYELVRISSQYEYATGETFLGIDVSTIGGYSLISCFLNYSLGIDDDPKGYEALFALVKHYFVPKLNINCLFDSIQDARFFLNVTKELQSLYPNAVEGDVFSIYFLYCRDEIRQSDSNQ